MAGTTVNSGFGGFVYADDLVLSRDNSINSQFTCPENEPGLQRRVEDEQQLRTCALEQLSFKIGKPKPKPEEDHAELEV